MGWLQVKSARKVVAMPLGKKAPSMQTKPGKAKGGTLDARFTRLLELRGDASARQTGAREQLLAKKRGMKAAPVVTEARQQNPSFCVQIGRCKSSCCCNLWPALQHCRCAPWSFVRQCL